MSTYGGARWAVRFASDLRSRPRSQVEESRRARWSIFDNFWLNPVFWYTSAGIIHAQSYLLLTRVLASHHTRLDQLTKGQEREKQDQLHGGTGECGWPAGCCDMGTSRWCGTAAVVSALMIK